MSRRLSLAFACLIALAPLFAGAADSKRTRASKTEYYKGKVVPLADLVAKAGSRLDPDAAPHWLALVGDDGKIYPLVKDSGSRMFFKDAALLKRPMRLTGRLLPGSQLLRVTAVHSYIKGELHEVYYWCDICSIRRSEKNLCECCGGPMELHEDPLEK
ncbi:MAG TPA: hypothetical protein VN688_18090 [Gemmataceae bacterium]|nr:hypothetical protein [Gemmataceae bacterium]